LTGIIIGAHLNAPGSWHDSRVAQPIYQRLQSQTPQGFYLVADTAFPRGTASINGRIKAPLKAGQAIHGTTAEITEAVRFNRELLSYRQTAEWGNHGLQGSFGRLRVPLEVTSKKRRGDILETCIRAFTLRTQWMGINQITSVYLGDDQSERHIWSNFENILFADQRRNDRVMRFHIEVAY
jgi:DDE superfamily endonuclease